MGHLDFYNGLVVMAIVKACQRIPDTHILDLVQEQVLFSELELKNIKNQHTNDTAIKESNTKKVVSVEESNDNTDEIPISSDSIIPLQGLK